jgi:CubicO group peptidase (beta-lactamase class C family)
MCSPIRFVLVFILATTGPAGLAAQTDEPTEEPTLAEQTEKLFFEWNRLDRPGGSVTVVHNGKVVFQRSYGLASLEYQVPNSDRTLYDVVALSEPITATAVARLVAEDRLSLADNVRTHLPELPRFDPPIKVQHLVDHTSGLWDWSAAWSLSGGYLADVITVHHVLALLARQPEPLFTPGSRYEHSASNYTLLAEIVARVTEEPFRDWMWAQILRPRGMIHSVVRDRRGESIEGSAEAYDYDPRRGYRRNSLNLAAPGAQGLYSSIDDMATWLVDLTAKAASEELLTEGTFADGSPSGSAHGMRRDRFQGLTRYHASGQWLGFNSALQLFPEQDFAVVILSNWVSGWVNPVGQASQIAALHLADEITAAAEAAPTPAASEPAATFAPDPSRYAQLAGDYRWEPGDVFAVAVAGEQLEFVQGRTRLAFKELEPDHFMLADYPYHFSFSRDDRGRAVSCLIQHLGDPDVQAPRIELADPGPEELAALAGEYRNTELESSYSVRVEDGRLVLVHKRTGETRLAPEAPDHFTASGAPFGLLEFVRDEHARVVGFKVDTMNVQFDRKD